MVSRLRHWLAAAALAAALCASGPAARAQDAVRATAKVDSNAITVGDWLTITIEVTTPGGVTLLKPELPDTIPGIELVRQEQPAPVTKDGATVVRSLLTVTAFDSGSYEFPAVKIPYTLAGDSARHVAATLPIQLTVHGIAVDTSQAIKDIKPPLSLPLTFLEILPYLLGAVLLAGLVWLAVYVIRKRKKGESIIPAPPPRPAHEVAMEELTALEADQLWQQGKVKEFHSRVTEIVRAYIEDRFRVRALEQTSDEILDAGAIRALPAEPASHLRSILVRADLVKFAKFQPAREEHDASLASAKAFVGQTAPRVVAEPAVQGATEAAG
jgi:hypothetical protein